MGNPSQKLHVELSLNEETVLTSEEEDAPVENTPPEVSYEGDTHLWLNDPWDEKKTLELPLKVTDREDSENGVITLSATGAGTSSDFIEGLGTVSVVSSLAKLVIKLIDTPNVSAFKVAITASDDQATSAPTEISFTVEDLISRLTELDQPVVSINDGTNSAVKKNLPFRVVLRLGEADTQQAQDTQAMLQAHMHVTVQLTAEDEPVSEPVPLVWDDNNRAVAELKVPKSGEYKLHTLCNTGTDKFTVSVQDIAFSVAGAPPTVSDTLLKDTPNAVMVSPDGVAAEMWRSDELSVKDLFTDENQDDITVSVTVNQQGKALPLTQKGNDVIVDDSSGTDGVEQTEPFCLVFRTAGEYNVTLTAKDEDGTGASRSFTITVLSSRASAIRQMLMIAGIVVAALILLAILAYLLKPSFKGKAAEVEISSPEWNQRTVVPLSAWGKKKRPMYQLLTCTACPPETEIYEALASVIMIPGRRCIRLKGTQSLDGHVATRISAKEKFSIRLGHYDVTISYCEDDRKRTR